MVPEGWKQLRLGDVAEFQRGFDLPTSQRVSGDVPIISSGGHTGDHNEARVPGPGLVTGRYGSIGEVYRIARDFWPLNTTLWVKDFHGNDIDYAYYLLQTIDYAKFSDKTGVPGINRNDIHRIEVAVPPLPEQKKIAEILSTWDRAIDVTERLLENAKTQKRALMQQLLTGKRRFREFEGQPWRETNLRQIAKVDQQSLGAKTDPDYAFRYVSLSNVVPGRIVEPLECMRFANAPSRARRLVSCGDLLISTVRPNLLGFARIEKHHSDCVASTGFAVVSPMKNTDPSYLFHYLFGHHMRSQFHALVVGSNYPAINSTDVKKLRVKTPSFAEQERIGKVLNDCDTEINLFAEELDQLRTEKKALMQQLLTGKRRVTV